MRQKAVVLILVAALAVIAGCGGGSIQDSINNNIGGGMSQSGGAGHVVFLQVGSDDVGSLRLVDMETKENTEILSYTDEYFGCYDVLDSSDTIVYSWGDTWGVSNQYELYSIKTDGTQKTQLTDNASWEYWCKRNAAGDELYYSMSGPVSGDTWQRDVYAMSLPSGTPRNVTNSLTAEWFFDVAADESFIVSSTSVSTVDDFDLVKFDVAGNSETTIVSADDFPDKSDGFYISPDSTKIAFLGECDSSFECKKLYIMDKSGNILFNKLASVAFSYIVWSADSRSVMVNDVLDTKKYSMSNGAYTTLLEYDDDKEELYIASDASADGKKLAGVIIHVGGMSAYYNVFTADTDGTNIVNLTGYENADNIDIGRVFFSK